MHICTNCRYQNHPSANFCARCGQSFEISARNRKQNTIVIIGGTIAMIVFVTLFVILAILVDKKKERQQLAAAPAAAKPAETPAPTPKPDPKEIIAKLKAIMTRDKEFAPRSTLGEMNDLISQLDPNSKERKEAEALYFKQQQKVDKLDELAKLTARRVMAKAMEEKMLQQGFDCYISTSGKDHRVFTMKYVLMSRPFVYKIQNEMTLLQDLREAGFHKAVFTDGYDDTWSFDLTQ